MDTLALSQTVFHYIWSSLQYPNETNHTGIFLLERFRYYAMSESQKQKLESLVQHRYFNLAEAVHEDLYYLLKGNRKFAIEAEEALKNAKNDTLIPMPPIELPKEQVLGYAATESSDSESSGWDTLVGILKLILAIVSIIMAFAR